MGCGGVGHTFLFSGGTLPSECLLTWLGFLTHRFRVLVQVLWDSGGRAEGVEIFEATLSHPSPGAFIEGRNATVVLAQHGIESTVDAVEVTVHLAGIAAEDIALDTEAGAEFALGFAADVCSALGVSSTRLIVTTVHSGSAGAVLTFSFLPPGDGDDEPSAAELASAFVESMMDPQSALYSGRVSGNLDISFEPIVRMAGTHDPHGQPTGSSSRAGSGSGPQPAEGSSAAGWIALAAVLGVALVAAGIAYHKRVALSEWLLWRLGNFRFRTLRDPDADGDAADGAVMEQAAPIGKEDDRL